MCVLVLCKQQQQLLHGIIVEYLEGESVCVCVCTDPMNGIDGAQWLVGFIYSVWRKRNNIQSLNCLSFIMNCLVHRRYPLDTHTRSSHSNRAMSQMNWKNAHQNTEFNWVWLPSNSYHFGHTQCVSSTPTIELCACNGWAGMWRRKSFIQFRLKLVFLDKMTIRQNQNPRIFHQLRSLHFCIGHNLFQGECWSGSKKQVLWVVTQQHMGMKYFEYWMKSCNNSRKSNEIRHQWPTQSNGFENDNIESKENIECEEFNRRPIYDTIKLNEIFSSAQRVASALIGCCQWKCRTKKIICDPAIKCANELTIHWLYCSLWHRLRNWIGPKTINCILASLVDWTHTRTLTTMYDSEHWKFSVLNENKESEAIWNDDFGHFVWLPSAALSRVCSVSTSISLTNESKTEITGFGIRRFLLLSFSFGK